MALPLLLVVLMVLLAFWMVLLVVSVLLLACLAVLLVVWVVLLAVLVVLVAVANQKTGSNTILRSVHAKLYA